MTRAIGSLFSGIGGLEEDMRWWRWERGHVTTDGDVITGTHPDAHGGATLIYLNRTSKAPGPFTPEEWFGAPLRPDLAHPHAPGWLLSQARRLWSSPMLHVVMMPARWEHRYRVDTMTARGWLDPMPTEVGALLVACRTAYACRGGEE